MADVSLAYRVSGLLATDGYVPLAERHDTREQSLHYLTASRAGAPR